MGDASFVTVVADVIVAEVVSILARVVAELNQEIVLTDVASGCWIAQVGSALSCYVSSHQRLALIASNA